MNTERKLLVGFARLCLRLLVGLALLGLPVLQPVSAGAPPEGEAPTAGHHHPGLGSLQRHAGK